MLDGSSFEWTKRTHKRLASLQELFLAEHELLPFGLSTDFLAANPSSSAPLTPLQASHRHPEPRRVRTKNEFVSLLAVFDVLLWHDCTF